MGRRHASWDVRTLDAKTWVLRTRELRTWGREDVGMQGHADKQTTSEFCAEFAIYNFQWSRERYFVMESLPVAEDFQRP